MGLRQFSVQFSLVYKYVCEAFVVCDAADRRLADQKLNTIIADSTPFDFILPAFPEFFWKEGVGKRLAPQSDHVESPSFYTLRSVRQQP